MAFAGSIPLNGRMQLAFPLAIDALSVNARSVRVTDAGGRPLPARRTVRGRELFVELVVTPELLADPPREVVVDLARHTSVHAVRTPTAERIHQSRPSRFRIGVGLVAEQEGSPRLLSLGGHPTALKLPRRIGSAYGPEGLVLVYDRPLDPATITPAACPLSPSAEGMSLTPVLPDVDWTCVGQRFELTLRPPQPPRELLLSLRRFGLRGIAGEVPQPAPEVELAAS